MVTRSNPPKITDTVAFLAGATVYLLVEIGIALIDHLIWGN